MTGMFESADPSSAGLSPSLPAPIGSAAWNLLLVAHDRHWSAAVADAATDLGIGDVAACDARSALARLSGCRDHYSHLLVQPESADGLLAALVDVTSRPAGSDTATLVLGGGAAPLSGVGVIAAPDRRSVRAALSSFPRSQAPQDGAMLPSELREALTGAMIENRYQPIVSLADGKPFALEALARLNHPVYGTLPPESFVPEMEAAGLASELTEIVSSQAFADMTGPFLSQLGLRVTVNFPLNVLLTRASLDRLEAQRVEAGIPADRIVVELTESRPADDVPTLRAALDWLRSRGYKVAIDDVGPAVPRLTPLLDLPFTGIKLDMGMVQQVETNEDVRTFLARSIDRAHARGMAVVAEGVETIELWRAMKALGVDAVQGFLVARPLPPAAVPIWLTAWNDSLPIV
jgi:EAL domain-containing protein (putative c-di-GMP-specific phosphodiesterase class I)